MRKTPLGIGLSSVTVCAPDLALSHLTREPFQADIAPDRRAYVEHLVALVVELQHNRIGLTAVNTRMRKQIS